jgi:hypothetical protein
MCFKCPLEISLRQAANSNDGWFCRIFLRLRKTHNKQVHNNNPWVDAPTQQVHFLDLKDKTKVEHAIKRAQTAILNPSTPWTVYATLECNQESSAELDGASSDVIQSDEENLEVKFSPNAVFMEVAAPLSPSGS